MQFLAVLRQEARLQWRSTRFRVGVVSYLLIANSATSLTFFFLADRIDLLLEGQSYLALLLLAQPLATVLLAVLVAGNQSGRAALQEQWIPLASASISHLGYLMRRWLAQQILLLPLTLLPLVMAWGLAWSAGCRGLDGATWLGQWAILVLPVSPIVGAFWLGMSIIAGGELVALMLSGIGLNILDIILDRIFFSWHLTMGGVLGGFRQSEFLTWLSWAIYWMGNMRNAEPPDIVATQAAADLGATWQWVTVRSGVALGLSVVVLLISAAFLGRTRKDLQPIKVSRDHSLRSYIALLNRLRQRYAPDAAMSRWEFLGIAVGLGLFIAAIVHHWGIQRMFQGQATARYVAAKEWALEPLPPELVVSDWALQGSLQTDGQLETITEGTFEYQGNPPLHRLVFTLNPGLEVLESVLPGYRVAVHRQWDRFALDVEPALAKGDTVRLRVRVAGHPGHPTFGMFRGNTFRSFVDGFESNRAVRFSRYLADFSYSEPHASISNRRVDLRPGDLGPLPRFTTWQLTPPTKDPSRLGQLVLEETFRVPVDISVQLDGPAPWKLADACGTLSTLEGQRQVLSSRCRTSLTSYVVRGGRFERLESAAEGIEMVVLKGHEARGRTLLRSLGEVQQLSRRAWEGLPGLDDLAVLEWPPSFTIDPFAGMKAAWWAPHQEELHGNLLSLPEGLMVSSEPLRAERLVGRIMARDLLRRRQMVPSQAHLFRELFASLTVRRMGLHEGGAAFTAMAWDAEGVSMPLLSARPEHSLSFELRLPAVLAEAEHRVGSHHFYAAIETFLSRQDGTDGTVEELFETLQATSGVDLKRFFEDHFVNSTLPNLRLREVRRTLLHDQRWQVSGELLNRNNGQSICPVVVKTETGEERLVLTVEETSAEPFSIVTKSPPLTVVLDPRNTCVRVRFRGESPTLERVDLVGTEEAAP